MAMTGEANFTSIGLSATGQQEDTQLISLDGTTGDATFAGDVDVEGDSNVDGNVTVAGSITAAGSLLTGWADTADGTIPARRLVKLDSSGDTVVGTVDSLNIIGINNDNAQRTAAQTVNLAIGKVTAIAAAPIKAGYNLKCADNGRVCHLLDANRVSQIIKTTSAGSAFTNQPANDQITIVSSGAGDTTQSVTIIGTTNGGVVVVVEVVALTGTSPVTTIKTDWGVVLAIKLSASCAGTVTVKETSGGLTIKAITTGNLSAGVDAVTAASQGACNGIPAIVCSGTGTKTIGIQYTQNDGTTVAYQAAALNGTGVVALTTAALLVTEVYSGDLEAARTANVLTRATEDDENAKVGKALEAAAAAATVACLITP